MDPRRVRQAREAGDPVVDGDGAHTEILEAVGLKHCTALVITFAEPDVALGFLKSVRKLRPDVPVLVRTQDDTKLDELQKADATEVVPETLEASLMPVSHLLLHVPVSRVVENLPIGLLASGLPAGKARRSHLVSVPPVIRHAKRTLAIDELFAPVIERGVLVGVGFAELFVGDPRAPRIERDEMQRIRGTTEQLRSGVVRALAEKRRPFAVRSVDIDELGGPLGFDFEFPHDPVHGLRP